MRLYSIMSFSQIMCFIDIYQNSYHLNSQLGEGKKKDNKKYLISELLYRLSSDEWKSTHEKHEPEQ